MALVELRPRRLPRSGSETVGQEIMEALGSMNESLDPSDVWRINSIYLAREKANDTRHRSGERFVDIEQPPPELDAISTAEDLIPRPPGDHSAQPREVSQAPKPDASEGTTARVARVRSGKVSQSQSPKPSAVRALAARLPRNKRGPVRA